MSTIVETAFRRDRDNAHRALHTALAEVRRLEGERDAARRDLARLGRRPDFLVTDGAFGITPDGEVHAVEPHVGHVEGEPQRDLGLLVTRWEEASQDTRLEAWKHYDAERGI